MNKYKGLEDIIKEESRIKYNELMSKHTTMRVGGPCECMVIPNSIEEIQSIIKYADNNDIKYYIIGNGSNLLVKDEGVNALIIKIAGKFNEIKVNGNYIEALAGATMPAVAQIAKKNLLTGFEFACGIPGTIGGGTRMNAGAYGGELADVIEEVTYLDEKREIINLKKDELEWGYRHSIFTDRPQCIILKVIFKLQLGNKEEIVTKMEENNTARKTKQPLEYPNFGSVFKRPEGYFVGKLVSDSGLRGYKIGGAQVSKKHTGFIVNIGGATCRDVLDLIKYVQDTVYEKFKVSLQTEVIIIGGND